jgi:MOSC domain-containing protein YiiM
MDGAVVAVSSSAGHSFSKQGRTSITLLAGLGVEGDAHAGVTVQHRSRVARDPTQPNLRQVHLMPQELFRAVGRAGFAVAPGDLGENITTTGLDLLGLPVGALLGLGAEAVVEVTGLRNPCRQIDDFSAGLLRQVLHRGENGAVVRLAGIMGIVVSGGTVRPGDPVTVRLPRPPFRPLDCV